jgi:PEGA domain-containing protein
MKVRASHGLFLSLLWLVPAPAVAQPSPAESNDIAQSRGGPLAVTAPASPADVERAKESFKAGAAAYAAGEYLAAIQALDAAYALTPLPAIAFSLAQAERRQYFVARRPEHLLRSISLFRRYVEQVQTGGRRADAVEALSQLEPMAAKAEEPSTALGSSAASPAPADRSTRLMVSSDTPGARIWIDGVELSASPLLREVTPGEHRVRVTAPGFHDRERVVTAVRGEFVPVSVSLAELSGMLELQTPASAEIYVDGVFASQGGGRVVLGVPSGTHRVSIVQNGYRLASRRVDVAGGKSEKLSIELEPSTQRITSNVLMIGSAAALGTGLAFSWLAVNAENRAQAFLTKQQQENVSNADLVRYSADVTQRDRYRFIAGAGFASSLGLLVSGLFLHELDRPGPEDLNRGGFDLTAVVSPDLLGARLRGAF